MASKVYRMTEARRRAIEQYTKEYKRISRYVKSLTKKGYKVPEGIVPAKPSSKTVKQLSTAEIKKQTKEAEYLKSYRILHKSSIEIKKGKTTEVISGEEYQDILREKRREDREYERTHPLEEYTQEEIDKMVEEDERERRQLEEDEKQFQEFRKRLDEEVRKKAKEDAEYKRKFSEAEVAFNTVVGMINDVSNAYNRGYEHVKKIWDEEVNRYGKDKVIANIVSMGSAQDLIEAATYAIMYAEGSSRHDSAISALITLIRGAIPSAQDMKDMEEALDNDAYTENEY